MQICTKCKQTKELEEFHKRKSSKSGLQSQCKECNIKINKLRHKHNYIKGESSYKETLKIVQQIKVKYGCQFCEESIAVCLEFHHKDPLIKNKCISRLLKLKDKSILFREINQCIVVCSNCHRKIHYGYIDDSQSKSCNENVFDYFDNINSYWKLKGTQKIKKEYFCLDCKTKITRFGKRCRNCGRKVAVRKSNKRPTKEQLLFDLKSIFNITAIAQKYHVSDNAVRKWLLYYDISKTEWPNSKTTKRIS